MNVKYLFLTVTLLIIIGCSPYSPKINFPIKSPPIFSFANKDPNNTNTEYIKRMKKYDNIIRSSPIPVFIMDQNDLPSVLNNSLQYASLGQIYGLCNFPF